MAVTLPFEEIRKHRAKLLKAEEPFKQKVRELLENSAYKEALNEEDKNLLQQFVDSEYIYFNKDRYIDHEVSSVSLVIEKYQALLNDHYLNSKLELLNLQSALQKLIRTREIISLHMMICTVDIDIQSQVDKM
jgi:hypothetical protein